MSKKYFLGDIVYRRLEPILNDPNTTALKQFAELDEQEVQVNALGYAIRFNHQEGATAIRWIDRLDKNDLLNQLTRSSSVLVNSPLFIALAYDRQEVVARLLWHLFCFSETNKEAVLRARCDRREGPKDYAQRDLCLYRKEQLAYAMCLKANDDNLLYFLKLLPFERFLIVFDGCFHERGRGGSKARVNTLGHLLLQRAGVFRRFFESLTEHQKQSFFEPRFGDDPKQTILQLDTEPVLRDFLLLVKKTPVVHRVRQKHLPSAGVVVIVGSVSFVMCVVSAGLQGAALSAAHIAMMNNTLFLVFAAAALASFVTAMVGLGVAVAKQSTVVRKKGILTLTRSPVNKEEVLSRS